jgi:hypothetical protein
MRHIFVKKFALGYCGKKAFSLLLINTHKISFITKRGQKSRKKNMERTMGAWFGVQSQLDFSIFLENIRGSEHVYNKM